MNEAQKSQRMIRLASSGMVCEICGKQLTPSTWQGAHRIANTKNNRVKWGALIMDHPLNIRIVCGLSCNQACNIGQNPGECLKLAEQIIREERRKYPGDDSNE